MKRRLYLWWMHRRGKHVIATDCWCNPTIESYSNK